MEKNWSNYGKWRHPELYKQLTQMNSLDKQYTDLLKTILEHGVDKKDRTGTGTKSIFGYTIRHNMKDGFPLLTTKKMPFKTIVTELLWFLRGDTNIKFLVDNNCHIWDGDAYKSYENNWLKENPPFAGPYTDPCLSQEEFINKIKTDDDFAKEWGELGPIYGKQWRSWKRYRNVEDIEHNETLHIFDSLDQIANLINDLKTNPDSRRLMVNAWNVGELDQMVLPPCHFSFQCYSHEREGKRYLSLAWNQRSVDVGLGLPFNIASYALLLMMIADEVQMVPDQLIGNLGDCHIYNNHIEGLKEQLNREPFPLPKVHVRDGIYCSSHSDVLLFDYQSYPTIKLPLSN
jgi:thymidylate synthase